VVRRRYLKKLFKKTGRNVIVYYSGWLQKPDLANKGVMGFELNDADKNGFMAAIHGLERNLGLDLILHTPGGDIAATESLVDYLRQMFDMNIRAIVPQLAMSAGTMIALACKSIVMGKHSSLGPIDPQLGGLPAHGIIEEADNAIAEVTQNPATAPLYQMLFASYGATTLGEAQKAIDWSEKMVKTWLATGMFDQDPDQTTKIDAIMLELGSHARTLSHARHISMAAAKSMGLQIETLEKDPKLQEAVLSVHHACVQTLSATPAIKIIENHKGTAYIDVRFPVP
jgi:hypothetical protein